MIKAKVSKNIMRQNAILHFSISQIVTGIIGLIIGIGIYFLLKDAVEINILMWIIFIELIVVIGFGVAKVNGMSLIKFIIVTFKTDKRPYNSKGVFNSSINQEDNDYGIF